MAKNVVTVVVKSKDEASKTLDKISKRAAGLGATLGKALKVGALAGGVAIAGLGVASLKMAADFEKSFAEVKTLLPTLSDEGFNKLRADLLDLSKEMGIATDQAVPALYSAISAGVPPDNVIDFMRTASMAAVGGVTELETAVDGITSVVNAYGAEAISAGKASDIMFTGVRLGKTTFEELSASLFNVLPTAASLGITFEDVTAQLAALTAQGVPTSVATTQIRAAMVEAGKTGTNLDKALRELSGVGFADLIASGKTMPEVFEGLRQSMPEQAFKDLFGSVEAMNAVLGITGPNFDTVTNAFDETTNSAGATEAAFETVSDTMSFKLNKAINVVKIELLKFGLAALPLVTKGMEFLFKVVGKVVGPLKNLAAVFSGTLTRDGEKMQQAFDKLPEPLRKLGWEVQSLAMFLRDDLPPAIKSIIGALGDFKRSIDPVLQPLRDIFLKGFKLVMDNKEAIVGMFVALGVAIVVSLAPAVVSIMIAFAPFLAAIAVGGAIALGITLLIKNFDAIEESIKGFTDSIPGLNIALGLAEDAIGDVIDFVKDLVAVVENVVQLVSALASGDWSAAWTEFKQLAMSILNVFLSWLELGFIDEIAGVIIGAAPKLAAAGGDLFMGLIDGIKGAWNGSVKPFLVGLPETILTALGDFAILLFDLGKDLLQGLLDGVKSHWQSLLMVFFGGLPGLILAVLIETGIATKLVDAGKDLLQGLLDGVKDVWDNNVEFWFSTFPTLVVDTIGDVASTLFDLGNDLLTGLLDGIKDTFDNMVQLYLHDLPTLVFDTIGDVTETLFALGVDLLTGLFNGILDTFDNMVRLYLIELPSLIFNTIGSVTRTLFGRGVDLLTGLLDGIKDTFRNMVQLYLVRLPSLIFDTMGDVTRRLFDKGKDLIQGLIDGMFSVPIPNPLDLIPDLTPGFDLPGPGDVFHSGGIVPGPVGRNRLILAQGGEAVLTPAQQQRLAPGVAQRGGVTINININAIDGASVEAIAPEMAREIHRHLVGTGAAGLLT